jgi:predicted dehydrogenase
MAHIHVNWLSPTKIRQMVIGGTRRTLVWDDLNPQQRLSVYDRGIQLPANGGRSSRNGADRRDAAISYRLGDTWSPALPEREALGQMVEEFAAAIRGERASATSGMSALRVLGILEATTRSLTTGGAQAPMGGAPAASGYARQIVDQDMEQEEGALKQEAGA